MAEKAVPEAHTILFVLAVLAIVPLAALGAAPDGDRRTPRPSLHTHKEFFASEEHGEAEAHWPIGLAVGTLLVVTVLVALVSEIFVVSVQKAAETFGMSPAFVGLIIVSIVGAAAEIPSNVWAPALATAQNWGRTTTLD